ncbi:MAG: EAL domain-containing protein [Lachnospiraceae bacterium]|nr:EAL domain-containing protein [Lachnospiraceae bacterium]
MSKKDDALRKSGNMDKMLESLTKRMEVPKSAYILILLLYFLASFIVSSSARSAGQMLNIMGQQVPATALMGVFSALSNICTIFLVVFFHKVGFITSLVLVCVQFPMIIMTILRAPEGINSAAGIFSNIFALTASFIIFLNDQRIEKYQKRMRDQAVTDNLTGLPNRFASSEFMEDLIRRDVHFALVSCDFNNFKSINDTMGHVVGNQVLIEIASRWKKLAESYESGTVDFVARLGGDEFAIVIRGGRTDEDVLETIHAYEDELEKCITVDDCDYFMTASFGYAEYPADGNTVGVLFSGADAAMHEAMKQGSGSRVKHFTGDLLEAEHAMEIERKLRLALESNHILCYLQPQYDMDHKLRGFESLARMKDMEGKLVSPGEFIPVAEKTGLIDKVDICVFKKAAAFFGELVKKGRTDLILSINISVRHLMKNNFLDEIRDIIDKNGVPANQLEIEITESIMIDSAEKALKCIDSIKDLGIRVAIDDFGTGYSSLSYLNSFPADLLKIDKSFIDVMNNSERSRQYVASIVSIGHILRLEVIAEGVEAEEQLNTLKETGCDLIQGFVWGRPMPLDEAAKLVG